LLRGLVGSRSLDERELRTETVESERDRAPDASTRPGDDGDTVLERSAS